MNDDLGNRMKRYEVQTQNVLVPRMPAILRIDGRSFHTFTKGFKRPYDHILSECMQEVGWSLLEDISTAVFAYGQSDEVSVLLLDYKNFNTQQWFDGKIQKIVSTAASLASCSFNNRFRNELMGLEQREYYQAIAIKVGTAMFDARIFSIPEDDVANYFYWRWKDCLRNSVSMAASNEFSHRELQGKSCEEMKAMLREYNNHKTPWENMPSIFKDGWFIHYLDKHHMSGMRGDIRSLVEEKIKEYLNNE